MESVFVLLAYFCLRLGLDSYWNQISIYYCYLFEIVFVLIAFLIYKKKKNVQLITSMSKEVILRAIPWFIVGLIIHKLAKIGNFIIPFDMKNAELIVMLLVIAPILEELIFRMALWEAIDDFVKNIEIKIWISSILFSIGHLIVFFSVPTEIKPFVLYQAVYVVILGIGASKMKVETKGVTGAILVHFLFNLGFYVGTYI